MTGGERINAILSELRLIASAPAIAELAHGGGLTRIKGKQPSDQQVQIPDHSFTNPFANRVNTGREEPMMIRLEKVRRFVPGVLAALVLIGAPQAEGGVLYDAAADFSISSNPNGAWMYGQSDSLGGPFSLYTQTTTGQFGNLSFYAWYSSEDGSTVPTVLKNVSSTNQQGQGANLDAGELALHPGQFGEYSIVRWVAPSDGTISLSALFQGRDNVGGTTTDVHILDDNVQLFGAEVTGFGIPSYQGFTDTIGVHAGDTIDFAVGYGSNGNYSFDTTGLDAQINFTSAVPEPSSLVAGVIGLALCSGFVLFRRIVARSSVSGSM
jgi:hypothetical protein